MDVVEEWARDWQLQLSVEECNVLHIGSCLDNCRYHIGHLEIQSIAQCKDLSIVVANDLSQQQHIDEITAKVHRRACFISRKNDLLVRAFGTYVCPILEYNSIVWSPSLLRDIEQVEKVQGPFTKRPFGKR